MTCNNLYALFPWMSNFSSNVLLLPTCRSCILIDSNIRGFQWLFTGIITPCIAHHYISVCHRLKLVLLRKIILLSIRIQLLQVGSNKTLLEKLLIHGNNAYRLFTTDCKCHIYHRLPVSHLPSIVSVTFSTDYQNHFYHWLSVSHLPLITTVTFIIDCHCHNSDYWGWHNMWDWHSLVNVTLTYRGNCDTYNQW
jgi:hypothetical protein